MRGDETYLGDGLYASVENGMIKLRAPREDGDHVVFMEMSVWMNLERFVADKITEVEG